jgi:uncharacterized protein (TIGR03083 family)
MQTEPYLAALTADGDRLLAAARAGLDAPVPACDGWVVADVVGHLGRVYRSVAEIVGRRSTEIVPSSEIDKPPPGEAVVEWFATGHASVLEALRGVDPETPVYTWSDEQRAEFYFRRMVHETAIHRLDVQRAVGVTPDPFDGDLAADGIDEFYGLVLPFALRRWDAPLPTGSLHLHRTDGEGEWTISAPDGVLAVAPVHGKADAAVRGPGSDLFAFVWHRGRSDALEGFGDAAVADAWAALAP